MKYYKIKFTKEQKLELIRLMVGMAFVVTPVRFDMGGWASIKTIIGKQRRWIFLGPMGVKNECGTAACLMGHAPIFCELKPSEPGGWASYRERLFGADNMDNLGPFLFSSNWTNSYNQAVARIYIALTKGVPNLEFSHPKYSVPSLLTIENYAYEHGVLVEDVSHSAACCV